MTGVEGFFYFYSMTNKELKSIFKNSFKENNDIELALKKLREKGASQTDCVKIIKVELNVGLRKADEIVLNSETWKDTKTATLSLRKEFDKFFESYENE